jgi:transcriptional regulator with XRE-family HTH domain
MASGRKADPVRRAKIARLRARGLTFAEIGRRLGVTRQCVQLTLRALQQKRTYRVACAGCGADIVSDGALPSDAAAALCLSCLARHPETDFAERLKAFRLAAGLTKKELAARAGLGYEVLRHYERGSRKPRWPQIVPLVRVLGAGLVTLGLMETA